MKKIEIGQSLQNAEIERRAPDTTSGKCKPHEFAGAEFPGVFGTARFQNRFALLFKYFQELNGLGSCSRPPSKHPGDRYANREDHSNTRNREIPDRAEPTQYQQAATRTRGQVVQNGKIVEHV